MTKESAIQIIWGYTHVHHELQKADAILVLGGRDTRVIEYAADLWLDGWAPYLICSGSGNIHNNNPGRERFANTTEAEVFAKIASEKGVPNSAIIVENKSQNTGENYQFATELLSEKNIELQTLIITHKPHAERRAYATAKVWLPETKLCVTSPNISLEDYPNKINNIGEHWLHALVGEVQRIKEYPTKGFTIEQDVPPDVLQAYEFLVDLGYVNRLIKD